MTTREQPGTLFRWHRGGLNESMYTAGPCRSLAALHAILEHGLAGHFGPVTPESIEVKPYGYDERIGWSSYIVTVNGNAWGFTNGPLS